MRPRRIYLLTEVRARELDANLSLALEASFRGFEVVIIEEELFRSVFYRSPIPTGIVHLKSLRPQSWRIQLYSDLARGGFVLTSQDQESGLLQEDFERFSAVRYSQESLEVIDAVMAWGSREANSLKREYPSQQHKLHITGSPRADVWRKPNPAPINHLRQPFVVFSSNLSLLGAGGFWNTLGRKQKSSNLDGVALLERDLHTLRFLYRLLELLRQTEPEMAVVVRPHIAEAEEAWRLLLRGFPNVVVTRHGTISDYLAHAVALLHQGCTTGIEAFISGKPAFSIQSRSAPKSVINLADRLSVPVHSPEELLAALRKNQSRPKAPSPADVAELSDRLYIPSSGSSASKIIDIWEELQRQRPQAGGRNLRDVCWKFLVKMPTILSSLLGVASRSTPKFSAVSSVELSSLIANLTLAPGEKTKVKHLSGKCFLIS